MKNFTSHGEGGGGVQMSLNDTFMGERVSKMGQKSLFYELPLVAYFCELYGSFSLTNWFQVSI